MSIFNMKNFLDKAKNVHGNKYDYSKTKYLGYRIPVKIICKKHGPFFQRIDSHLIGSNCDKCFHEGKKLNANIFKKRSKKIHGNKYDYSLVEYKDNSTKIKIKCNICGHIFNQSPGKHFTGQGCPACSNHIKYTLDSFIKKSKKKFGSSRFDYSKVKFKDSKSSIILKCNNCGSEVRTTIQGHFYSKHGCDKCFRKELKRKYTKSHKDFVKDVKKISSNIEILSEYGGDSSIVKFKCKDCGYSGDKTAGSFLYKPIGTKNCPKCYRKKVTRTHEEFVKELKEINPNFIVLGKYIKNSIRVKLKCSICDHTWKVDPRGVLNHKSGCPSCSGSFGEQKIKSYLKNKNMYFKFQKKFKEYEEVRRYSFDFYVPELNSVIEFDGNQHFKKIEFFNTEKEFENYKKRDFIKNAFCFNKEIHMIRIYYKNFNDIEKILDEEINKILLHKSNRLGGRYEFSRYGK